MRKFFSKSFIFIFISKGLTVSITYSQIKNKYTYKNDFHKMKRKKNDCSLFLPCAQSIWGDELAPEEYLSPVTATISINFPEAFVTNSEVYGRSK